MFWEHASQNPPSVCHQHQYGPGKEGRAELGEWIHSNWNMVLYQDQWTCDDQGFGMVLQIEAEHTGSDAVAVSCNLSSTPTRARPGKEVFLKLALPVLQGCTSHIDLDSAGDLDIGKDLGSFPSLSPCYFFLPVTKPAGWHPLTVALHPSASQLLPMMELWSPAAGSTN